MRTIVNATISFEMVAIPVAVAGAKTGVNEPKFRTLHAKCRTPINEVKKCLICGEDADETIKGYEYTKGEFILFTDEELASVGSDRGKTITLNKFIKAADIKPFMIDSTYWLVPPDNETLAEPYGLLYQTLAETRKAGFGVESLWGKEKPCVVVPNKDYAMGGVLQLWTLHLFQDLVEPDFGSPVPAREAKKMAKMIIESNSGDFDPAVDLVTNTRHRQNELIAARISDKPLPKFGEKEEHKEVDLMGALRASVEEIEERNKQPKRKVAAKK